MGRREEEEEEEEEEAVLSDGIRSDQRCSRGRSRPNLIMLPERTNLSWICLRLIPKNNTVICVCVLLTRVTHT